LAANSSLPVLVWVYGGGFLTGGSAGTNGSQIVSKSVSRGTPIIYVNFNYRFGPLGFPQGSQATNDGILNLGLKDQLTALAWVQQNIRSFGGDPDKVTVFGESAGAISISLLFLNSNLQKFARGTILESGSQSANRIFLPDRDESIFQTFVSAVPECSNQTTSDVFDCLRQANTSEILSAEATAIASSTEFFPFQPVIDGPGGLIPDIPSKLLAKGQFTKLPFISGTNNDEGTIFTPTTTDNITDFVAFLKSLNEPETQGPGSLDRAFDRVLELYPDDPAQGSPFGTGNQTFGLSPVFKRAAAILGDMFFQSTRRQWINAASSHGIKTFCYHFVDPQNSGADGVNHGSEVNYVYGQLPSTAPASSQQLSSQMMDYWISFVVSQDPNDGKGSQRPNWPQFTPSNQVLMQLNGTTSAVMPDDYREEQIQFFNDNALLFHH